MQAHTSSKALAEARAGAALAAEAAADAAARREQLNSRLQELQQRGLPTLQKQASRDSAFLGSVVPDDGAMASHRWLGAPPLERG